MTDADRIKGAIYGHAVGDALGATVEFMPQEEIRRRYGVLKDIVGGGWLGIRPGEWTDDTDLMLAVAHGICVSPQSPVDKIGQEFLKWYDSNPRDVGETTRMVMERRKDFPPGYRGWAGAARDVHLNCGNTAGNGALMRTLPVGLAYKNRYEIIAYAAAIARMTHWDRRAWASCAIYSLAVRNIMNSVVADRQLAFERAIADVEKGMACESWQAVNELLSMPIGTGKVSPTGYVIDTMACVMWAFIGAESFEEAVIRAVNLGGDADTIGAITGGIAGAFWGYDAIPGRWIEKFTRAQKRRLDKAVNGLVELRL